MKKFNKTLILLLACGFIWSCTDEVHGSLLPFPNDVTFNEEENGLDIKVPALDFVQMDQPFTARAYKEGSITLNAKKNADGSHSGFALSNKNYRSYPWCNSRPHGSENVAPDVLKSATDTLLYSTYTYRPNYLKNFVVARIDGEEAYFTIDQPREVEHILINNCTYNYLAMAYGTVYSSEYDSENRVYLEKDKDGDWAYVQNPRLPDPSSSKYGVWYLPDYYNFAEGEKYTPWPKENAYVKVIATGYNNGTVTGTSEYYLALRPDVAPAPYEKWNVLQGDWAPWDLKSLGVVDKVVFTMDSSLKTESGKMKIAPYFCIDGIRLK